MSFHCRCRKCGARNALRQHINLYKREPTCRACGKPELRPDKWMNNRNTKAMTCYCDGHGPGYHYPHRRGSVWCNRQSSGEWKTYEQFVAEASLLEPQERMYG